MALNLSSADSYNSLNVAIAAYEEGALNSQRRAGYLALANGNLHQMEVVLEAQERSLNRVENARQSLHPSPPEEQDEEGGLFSKLRNSKGTPSIQLVDEDVDYAELFGNGGNSKLANYLEDCIGCNLRLKFDWQLQPINLLGSINGFLDQLELSLDKLKGLINPFKILEDICWALNHLATLCPQDIILVLMAIKMLLKRYLLAMFNIKLDWTVLLGPLLKALVGALSDLLDNIMALLMAPLDCALSGLKTANDLMKASQDFISSLQSAGSQVSGFMDSIKSQGLGDTLIGSQTNMAIGKDITWGNSSVLSVDGTPMPVPGQLEVSQPVDLNSEKPADALRIPTTFILTDAHTVQSALSDPNFVNSTWLDKMIIPLQEAIAWIRETFEKFLGSLHALESLVGGGISASLDNIGVLLFLKDIISLLMLIYKLISSNLDVKDWCSYLQANPQVLENAFSPAFRNATVEARGTGDNAELIVKQGPQQVAVIKTCVNLRSSAEQSILSSWIKAAESIAGAAKV